MPTYHLLIKGKVQGVFYRASAKKTADEIGVTGWVKNTGDNNAEAVATGTEEQVQKFISWCRQGPPSAIVTEVIVAKPEEMKFEDFLVIK